MDFRNLLEKKSRAFDVSDAYLELPGALASWVDKKGRRNIQVRTGENSYWEITLRGSLEADDLRILALQGIESVSVRSGKLFIEVRK